MYILGIIMGAALLLAKYGSFWLFTGGSNQLRIWYPFKKGPPEPIRDWIYKSPVRTGLLDTFAGWLGMHVLLALGGSIIATVAMVTYIVTCMGVIFLHIIILKISTSWDTPRITHSGYQFVSRRR